MIAAEPTALDRAMRAFRALTRAEDPARDYRGIWEYSVERADSKTFDGTPTSSDFPLPSLVGVPYRPSLAGSSCVPTKGTLVYVAFANADASRPVVLAFGPTVPSSATVDATGTLAVGPSAALTQLGSGSEPVAPGSELGRVVRYGDPVMVGVATGPISLPPGPPAPLAKVKA